MKPQSCENGQKGQPIAQGFKLLSSCSCKSIIFQRQHYDLQPPIPIAQILAFSIGAIECSML